MVFGIIPECRSASLRNKRSASPESSPKDDGTFSVDLPPGFYDVFVAVPAFTPMCRKVRIKPGAAVDTTFRMNADPLYAAEMGNRVDGVPRKR